jgi:sulfite reductase (NADPH) hemoprotein beta-component
MSDPRSNAPDRSRDLTQPFEALHPNERVKATSRGLRGTIAAGLAAPLTGGLPSESDQALLRLHGMYQQDDRDLRAERRRQKLEPAYQLMIRVRLPGGVCTPSQWLALDEIARAYGNRALRITTRQTFQFHGLLKRNVKATVRALSAALLDTIAACGDVNRTVVCSPCPEDAAVHAEAAALARAVSESLLPRSRAYYEIFLDEAPVAGGSDEETLYGASYLPRKLKIAFAIPPVNDVDVYTHDLGFVAVAEGGRLVAFDVLVGGGMGRTDNEPETYARLATPIGSCTPEQVVAVARAVVSIQRDFGDRVDRKHARLKYTLDTHGLPWFESELTRRLGFALGAARGFTFSSSRDRDGWVRGSDGRWHYGLHLPSGRVTDLPGRLLLTGLRELAQVHRGELRLTPNQGLLITNVADEDRGAVQAIIDSHRLEGGGSVIERHAMACVALPTCGLAMAEAERYLPALVAKLDALMGACGVGGEPLVVRVSGCPNGCSRPYVAEVALTGRALGRYNLWLGGGYHGERLARLYRENIDEATILGVLEPLLRRWAAERGPGERFGDFVHRVGVIPPDAADRRHP